MIKIDKAYCHQTDSVLTIYQVRDLHFDEDNDFNAKHATYECADADCEAALIGINATAVEFKNAPHFRLKKGEEHSEACDFDKETRNTKKPEEPHRERDLKDSDYPTVLHLEPQPVPKGTGKPNKPKAPRDPKDAPAALDVDREYTTTHETSILEHVVETWREHGKALRRVLLDIGGKKKWYPNAFKRIEWFYEEQGLIYWGHVKQLKKYKNGDYAITFVEKPTYEGESRQVGIYIPETQIQGYRKRRLFRRYLDALVGCEPGVIECYFVGAYPTLKSKDVVIPTPQGEKRFRPLEVKLTNLDHIVLRFDQESEDETAEGE